MNGLKSKIRKNLLGYLLVLPGIAFVLLINVYPLFHGIALAFQNASIYNLTSKKDFIGIDNFIKLFTQDKDFLGILGFTFLYTAVVVFGCYIIGLSLALLVNRTFRGRSLFRSFVLIPWVLPTVVAACAFSNTLSTSGIVNSVLIRFGVTDNPIMFFATPGWAKFSVIIMGLWKGFPFMVLTLLAGLQVISEEMYEAAAIDGASKRQALFYITLPLMKNISFIAIMLRFIWTFNNFEQVYLLTAGGPIKSTMTVSIHSYLTAFVRNDLSYGATITLTMMAFLMILIVVARMIMNRNEAE